MASFGDIARVLGYAELSGLGTAEEQRQRADRQAQLDLQRKRLEQETKTHELEWGMASPEELSFYAPLFKELGVVMPTTGQIRRRDIPSVLNYATQAANRPKNVDITELAGLAGVPLAPTVTATPGTQPGTFGEMAESGPTVTTGPPPPRMVRPEVAREILSVRGQTWRDRLSQKKEQRIEDQATVNSLAQDLYDQKRSAGVGHGPASSQAIQEAQARYPTVSVTKFPQARQPGAMVETAEGGFVQQSPYTGEIGTVSGFTGKTATAADREAARKDREARAKLTEESTRLQNEIRQARLDQIAAEKEADDVEGLIAAGKPIPEKAKDRAAKNLEASAKDYRNLAETSDDPRSQQTYMGLTAKLLDRAAKIRAYKPGQPAAPTGGVITDAQRAADRIVLQRAANDLYGKDWDALTKSEKDIALKHARALAGGQ